MTLLRTLRPATAGLALAVFVAPAPAQEVGEDPPIPDDTEVVVLPSGLKYSVLSAGPTDVEPASLGDRVLVHYTGWTTDGKVFDSSRRPRFPGAPVEPAEFGVGQLIDGWNEGLQLMRPGDRWKLTIPSELGYGERGAPRAGIEPDATLIFDVELVEIVERSMPHVPWDPEAEGIDRRDDGLAVNVLEPGEGPSLAEGDLAVVEFGAWNEGGQFVLSSTMIGKPLQVGKPQGPLRFFNHLWDELRLGADVLVSVPPDLAFGNQEQKNLPPGSRSIWRIRVVRLFDFERPEFRMPAAEELTTTESGLQYVVLEPGNGDVPEETDRVFVHYSGWFTDGEPFDSSYDRRAPSQFALNQVVAGWTEGLQLLREGGSAILVVPSDLGYGEQGRGKIPGGATLVFHVQLLAIQ